MLIDSAGLLFDFVDLVSRRILGRIRRSRAGAPAHGRRRVARSLLSRLEWGERPLPEDVQFAQLIGLDLAGPVLPFVVLMPEGPSDALTRLARRLRAGHALAAPGGRRLSGIANVRPPWRDASTSPRTPSSPSAKPPPQVRSGARFNVFAGAHRSGRGRGPPGTGGLRRLSARSVAPPLPGHGAAPRRARHGPLEPGRPDLVRTLDALVEHDFDRGRTAAALPVHRNTLTNRLRRVATLTGVDVDGAEGQAVVWLAWLERHRATSTPDRSNGARPGATPPGW